MNSDINTSAFSLAKKSDLKGEDFYEVQSFDNLTIAIICDGVGSALAGAEAAKRTTNYLINNFQNRPKSWSIEKSLKNFIKSINAILYKESQINYERAELVTTLAIIVIEGNRLYGANIGDTRVYLHRSAMLTQLSVDHAMEQPGFEHVLTRAIGIHEEVEPYYFENIIQNGDKILLCSDGYYNVIAEDEIAKSITLGAYALVKRASNLMNDTLPDDTTAIVLDVKTISEFSELKRKDLPIPAALKPGDTIDGYVIDKALVQNERTCLVKKDGKAYVMKLAPLEANDNEDILDLFVKEVWNAKRLSSTYLPKVSIPDDRTCRYYLMEYVKGENLKAYIKKKPVSIDDVIHLANALLAFSQYLLKYDLVHGDIKPENIIINSLEDEKSFTIVDFGNVTELFSIQSRAGTPSFLAPERFLNGSINESTELFSIGVTLYMVLTKHYPYGEIEPFSNPSFKEAKQPSFYNKNIPAWLDSVILRSIAIEPHRRYQHYSEMMYEISAPQKVKPYFSKESSLLDRSPILFYKTMFALMLIGNVILTLLLLSK